MRKRLMLTAVVLLSGCEPITINANSVDGVPSTPTTTVTLQPSVSEIEHALTTRDVSGIASDELLLEAIALELTKRKTAFDDVLVQLAKNVGPVTWDPTHDAAMLQATFGQHQVLLQTNAAFYNDYQAKTRTLALAGTHPGRFVAIGSNPMRTMKRGFASNENLNTWLDNVMRWLVADDLRSQRVVIAQMGQDYYFPDRVSTQEWFAERYPDLVLDLDCSDAKLAGCLAEPADLLVISQISNLEGDALAQQVKVAMEAGTPVLYMHYDGGMTAAGEALFELFDITYHHDNYWYKLGLRDQSLPTAGALPGEWQAAQRLVTGLTSNEFDYDVSCYASLEERCADFNEQFNAQFSQGASYLRSALNRYDAVNRDVFDEDRLLALWVLLGDYYRQSVSYPVKEAMAQSSHATATFTKALLADHLVFNSRPYASLPNDLGNFSRTDFSHVTPVTVSRDYTSKQHMRAAGVYVLPGQTVQVTRTDSSDVNVRIQINSVRSGATKEWGAYRRPKFLTSQAMDIKPNQTIRFTSVYGGPLQVLFSRNDLPVSLTYRNVGEHPFWATEADNESFANKTLAADYDWAEISTAGFEVHSTLDKMRTTIAPYENAAQLASLVETYTNSYPHALAGFQGPGVIVIDEVHDFVAERGWQVAQIDMVKHMNADQPTCGWGCSGNPYDAGWNFSPTGHGDLHELGHGLERSFFRFQGWGGHSTTNFYSYYSKARFYDETGGAPSCQSLPFNQMYEHIQAAMASDDALAFMQAQPLNAWNQATATYIQWFMAVQQAGVVNNGFHVLPRLHIYERYLWQADNSDANWQQYAESLGYTTLTREQFLTLPQNDRLIMAMSVVSQRDMRAFLQPYGYQMTDLGASELARLGLASLPAQFFAMKNGSDYCLSMNQTAIDYQQDWPFSQ